MWTLWKIALRNTVRHARRTVITGVVMMVGIAGFIFMDSALAGSDRMAIDNMAAYTTSSLKIRNPAYVDDIEGMPLDKGLARPEAVLAAAASRGLAAAPRLRFVATTSNYENDIPVIADAVDPAADAKVFALPRAVTAGRWLEGAPEKSVVLGSALAAELKLGVGDTVLVSAQTVNDTTNADEYTIVGLLTTPAPEVNSAGLFMPLDDARTLLGAPRGLVTEVNVAMPRAASIGAALAASDREAVELRGALPGARVDPLSALAQDYLALRNLKARYSYAMILIVLLIAAVGIVNTILMSVYSRVREIGVLRAYGMVRRDILRLFTLEGLAVGIFGSLLGVAFGAALNLLMVVKGFSLDKFSSSMGSMPLSGTLHGEWNVTTMIVGFLFGVVVSVIAARIPARRAARLEPTAALRFQ
jgi:ABC-type lipoprotein release transport system permease subunit